MISITSHILLGIKIVLQKYPATGKWAVVFNKNGAGKNNMEKSDIKRLYCIILKPDAIFKSKIFKEYKNHLDSLELEKRHYSVLFNDEIPDDIIKNEVFETLKIRRKKEKKPHAHNKKHNKHNK